MTNEILYKKIDLLPDFMKFEANNYLDSLLHQKESSFASEKRKPGFLKGKIWISEDFDEPLEEFKDYM